MEEDTISFCQPVVLSENDRKDDPWLVTCILVVMGGTRSVCGEFRRTAILNISFLQPHGGMARIPQGKWLSQHPFL